MGNWDGHRKPKQRTNARLRGIQDSNDGNSGGLGGEGSQASIGGMDADKGARSLLQAYSRDGVNRIEASLGIGKSNSQQHDQNDVGGGGLNPLRIPSIGRMSGQNGQMTIGNNNGVSPRGVGGGVGQIGKENTARRRNNRQGNNRARHKKYNAGNDHAMGGFDSHMMGNSMGAGGSIIHTGGAGAGNSIVQGSNDGGSGGGGGNHMLPQLVNGSQSVLRRQQQQHHHQQQQQQIQQQQQMQHQMMHMQQHEHQAHSVPRESLPSYVEEHSNAACTSIKGLKPGNPNWTNQDNQFIIEKFDNRDINFYCVLDGHGENGHHVSKRAREVFPQYIRSSNLDMKRSFTIMQNDLSSCEFDVRCSGATCVLASLCGARLSVSNCGDSRAVLGRRNPNGSVTAHALTQDHKPDKPEERKRILACGGHLGCRQVLVNQPGRGPISMPVGPCRVWYQNKGETLGLAMSRSLGDTIVHRSGVSAEPETLEHIVDEYDEFMIIATDGVWDVIDNNQAVQMVQNYSSKSSKWNPIDASNTICKFARSRWEKLSPMVDDITCIVVRLQNRR